MSLAVVPAQILPVELVGRVLSDITDKKSLKNCSLVSKTFLRPSQKYLFRSVKLVLVPEGLKNAQNTLEETNKEERMLGFLISSPVHSSMIFDLTISSKADPVVAKCTSVWTSTIENIRSLIPTLTHLRGLTIQSFFMTDWTMINSNLRNALFRLYILPTIRHLELQYTEVSEEDLRALMRIPRLTLVGLKPCIASTSDVTYEEGQDATPHPQEFFLLELTIVLRGSETAKFMSNVAKAAGHTLRKLCWLTSPYLGPYFSSYDLSNRSRPTIPADVGHVPPEMDLSYFPSLVLLSISIPLNADSIKSLTSLMRSPDEYRSQLEVVQLILDYEYLRDEAVTSSSWNWQALDAVLSSPRIPILRKLSISVKKMLVVYRPPSTKEYDIQAREAVSLFRSKLPSVLENGVTIEVMND